MRIVADTATLFSPAEGKEMGMTIIPVGVLVDGKAYQDLVEIDRDTFVEMIQAGGVPTSSQPSLGDVLEVMEESDEEMLMLTVADGLSGGYQAAVAAKNAMEKNAHIHIMDSQTLAAPLRYLAKKALTLREQGLNMETIKAELQKRIETSMSFVIPEDFEFLKRSGRLTSLTAKIGGTLKLLPVLTQTRDRKRIMPMTVKRSWKSAVAAIIQRMQDAGVDEKYLVSVCHANTRERAQEVMAQIREKLQNVETEILRLSPALMTHGGPGCIVVQAILK